jgi:hypothetical protein
MTDPTYWVECKTCGELIRNASIVEASRRISKHDERRENPGEGSHFVAMYRGRPGDRSDLHSRSRNHPDFTGLESLLQDVSFPAAIGLAALLGVVVVALSSSN